MCGIVGATASRNGRVVNADQSPLTGEFITTWDELEATICDALTTEARITRESLTRPSLAAPVSRDSIEALLHTYRCQYTEDDDGNGLPLVDVFTPMGRANIADGKSEVHLLADMLAGELSAPPSLRAAPMSAIVKGGVMDAKVYFDDPLPLSTRAAQDAEVADLGVRLDTANRLMNEAIYENEVLREQLAALSAIAPKDDVPLRCEVVNGAIEFTIGAKILAHATNISPNLYDHENDRGQYRVADPAAFAKDVARELNRESEDGSTPLTRLLDSVIEEAINQGAEGIEENSGAVDVSNVVQRTKGE